MESGSMNILLIKKNSFLKLSCSYAKIIEEAICTCRLHTEGVFQEVAEE